MIASICLFCVRKGGTGVRGEKGGGGGVPASLVCQHGVPTTIRITALRIRSLYPYALLSSSLFLPPALSSPASNCKHLLFYVTKGGNRVGERGGGTSLISTPTRFAKHIQNHIVAYSFPLPPCSSLFLSLSLPPALSTPGSDYKCLLVGVRKGGNGGRWGGGGGGGGRGQVLLAHQHGVPNTIRIILLHILFSSPLQDSLPLSFSFWHFLLREVIASTDVLACSCKKRREWNTGEGRGHVLLSRQHGLPNTIRITLLQILSHFPLVLLASSLSPSGTFLLPLSLYRSGTNFIIPVRVKTKYPLQEIGAHLCLQARAGVTLTLRRCM